MSDLAGVLDEVPDDEEIAGELHLLDAVDLALQALFVVGDGPAAQAPLAQMANGGVEPLAETRAANFGKIAVDGVARGYGKFRERIGDLVQLERTTLGKLHGAADHFRSMGEEPFHLRRALDVELVGIEFEALGVVDGVGGLHAEQHFVRMMIVFAEIVAVVGGDQRDVQLFFQAKEVGVDFLFQFQALVLDFEEEIAAAENVLILAWRSFGRFVLALPSGCCRARRPGSRKSRSGPSRASPGSFC